MKPPTPRLDTPASPRELIGAWDLSEFSLRDCLAACSVASASYRSDCTLALAQAGWSWAQGFTAGPTHVLVAASPEAIAVISRGTDERADWWDNGSACRAVAGREWRSLAGQTVHRGFLRQAERAREWVVESVTDFARVYRDAKLVFTGHSLGAPVASLLCHAVGLMDTSRVWAFNSPRWHHGSPARPLIQAPTDRVVTADNGELCVVTRVPPERWGWEHVGRLTVLDGDVRFTGPDAMMTWKLYRQDHPVGNIAAWRVLTRLRSGVEAHRWRTLLGTLSEQVGAEAAAIAARVGL